MDTQTALERADRVQAVGKGTPVADKYINYFEKQTVFSHFERNSPENKRMVKVIHAAEGLPGEFSFFLKYMD